MTLIRNLVSCALMMTAACGGAKASSTPAAAPKPSANEETNGSTACTKNDDCFCRVFDGAHFKPGRGASTCCADAAGCTDAIGAKIAAGHCMTCVYD